MNWGLIVFFLAHLLIMVFIMKRHGHGEGHKEGSKKKRQRKPAHENERLENYKVKQLEGEIRLLKNKNESLQKKVDDL